MKENLQRTSGAIDKIPIFPSFLSNISYLSLPLSVFIFTAPEKHTFVFIYYLLKKNIFIDIHVYSTIVFIYSDILHKYNTIYVI
jgi:hypothetical protein